MSHDQSQIFSVFQGFGDNLLLLGIIPLVVLLFTVYKKFGTENDRYGREGIFSKFEHKFVKVIVTAGVAGLALAGAHLIGLI